MSISSWRIVPLLPSGSVQKLWNIQRCYLSHSKLFFHCDKHDSLCQRFDYEHMGSNLLQRRQRQGGSVLRWHKLDNLREVTREAP